MAFFDSVKDKIALNLKVTKISFMTQRADIIRYCQELTPAERTGAMKAIESMFQWQSVSQLAQAMFPSLYSGGGVSAEARDMVLSGYVEGGLELMRHENQAPQTNFGGLLPVQQAALSFAWVVLKTLDQPQAPSFCTNCGQQRQPGARFCTQCGQAFVDAEQAMAAGAGASGGGETKEDQALFNQAYEVIQKAAASGETTGERADSVRSVLQKFQSIVTRPAETPEQLASQSTEMRELIERYKSIYATPKTQATARGQRVANLFATVRSFIFDENNQAALGGPERNAGLQFMLEAGHASQALQNAKDEDAVRQVEQDRLRPLVYGLRQYALRRHLMLVEPYWGWTKVEANSNEVFFAGSDRVREMIVRFCADRNLTLAGKPAAWGAGQMRWSQLRGCGLGVFDLSEKGSRPPVCHALGMALALGVQALVVAPDAGLPFDIDIRAAAADESLGDALDEALFAIPQTQGGSSLADTVREVLARSSGTDAETRVLSKTLSNAPSLDPVETGNSLALLAARNGNERWGLVRPLWSGAYPDRSKPRCFHVMPYSEPWSDQSREAVRAVCGNTAEYRRGDETGDPNVIRSIWDEICGATHVVVDVTGLNLNVCLELGLVQALGRNALLVSRSDRGLDLFPEIAKIQVKRYASPEALQDMVAEFVAS